MIDYRNYLLGPAMLVTAAFIGPGTVTACIIAGAQFGYALLWALAFATIATIILQSMASRIALVTDMGLAEAMLAYSPNHLIKWALGLLVLISLVIGNASYEGGNLVGSALGLQIILGENSPEIHLIAPMVGLVVALLVLLGKPVWLEKLLIILVLLMSISFIAVLILAPPDWGAVWRGFIPDLPSGSLLSAIALIGTTIVPYNLFLHAARSREWAAEQSDAKQGDKPNLPDQIARSHGDTVSSVALGGLISMAILIGAATALFGQASEIDSAHDFAVQLEPIFGAAAQYAVAVGLMGAGFSSAMTVPLATGYALGEIVSSDNPVRRAQIFRLSALAIIAIGMAISLLQIKPTQLLLLAQSANGLLLPLIAVFMLWLAASKRVMGEFANHRRANIAGVAVVLVAALLGFQLIAKAVGVWP